MRVLVESSSPVDLLPSAGSESTSSSHIADSIGQLVVTHFSEGSTVGHRGAG